MFRMKLVVIVVLSFISLSSFGSDTKPMTKAERWKAMSPAQKDAIRSKYKKFMALPEARKMTLVSRFKKFEGFAPEKKLKIAARFQTLKNMTPEKRVVLRKRWTKWKSLSPQQKERSMKRLKMARLQKQINRNGKQGPGQIGGPSGPNRKDRKNQIALPSAIRNQIPGIRGGGNRSKPAMNRSLPAASSRGRGKKKGHSKNRK
jgi:predicted Fe-S protein YdhL (DUF1289 family)